MSVLEQIARALKHMLGSDRATLYAILNRVAAIMGGTGNMLLIIRFLSQVEQQRAVVALGDAR